MSSYYKIGAKSMGRRELYIALAFLAAGLAAYLVTAPAQSGTASRRSLPTLIERWRSSDRQTAARISHQQIGTTAVGPQVGELRVTGFSELHVTGENRPDIAWTLDVEAVGPDEATARATANSVGLQTDDLGEALSVAPRLPEGARLNLALRLRVPAGLSLQVESARQAEVSGVAGVRLDSVIGDFTVREVAGSVTGTHRNGALRLVDVGSVTLTLNGSRTVVQRVRGDATINVRNGDCQIERTAGAVTVDATNADCAITSTTGAVRVHATEGHTRVSDSLERVHVDVRRGRAEVALGQAVPVSVIGADAPITLTWPDASPIALDASTADGTVTASDFGLTAEQHGNVSRLVHAFGTRARVVLRTTRAPIVIAKRK